MSAEVRSKLFVGVPVSTAVVKQRIRQFFCHRNALIIFSF